MIPGVIVVVSFTYLLLLFAVAWFGDRRADQGRSIIASPTIYALSLAVYCTTWTFYGSVGRAASLGAGYLPIYLGPTLMMTLGYLVLRKVLRIAKQQRITSIADFIGARYGKSQGLGGLVAAVAVVGITPYIALQLKAVSVSFELLSDAAAVAPAAASQVFLTDKTFFVTLLMAAFAVVFGARSIDAAEHHEGLVAAVAFESVIKLLAFLALGIAVVWGMHDGPADLFGRAAADPGLARLMGAEPTLSDGAWLTNTLLAGFAILLLPRQFQMLVVENKDEAHLARAMWLFPLYLLLINLFVLPVALAGLMALPAGTVDPDMVVLALPLGQGWNLLAILVYLGGLSAAAGMIVVETVALSTMVSNGIVVPLLLRWGLLDGQRDISGLLLAVRRSAIVMILLLGYVYFSIAGSAYALVAIGLISFAAVAQFAPAVIGGLFWAGGTRRGTIAGLVAGVACWTYTLLLPSFARSGWFAASFIEAGPWGIELLRPYALFGLQGLDPLSHSVFWSMLANVGLYVAVSVLDRPGPSERVQATSFVEVFQQDETAAPGAAWLGAATVEEVTALVGRFIGEDRARAAFARFAREHRATLDPARPASAALVRHGERLLAGAIGAASARVALASAVRGGEIRMPELLRMLDETSHVIEYSHRLEQKSAELERTSAELRAANAKLLELDRLKDDFLSTVTHELRTPLTSIRAFAEILYDTPDIDPAQRQEFLHLITKESERLTRLINQVLDMAKIEAGQIDWRIEALDLAELCREAASTLGQVFRDKGVTLTLRLDERLPPAVGDRDRIVQVVLNLLSNAVKFAPERTGTVTLELARTGEGLRVCVGDNGPGLTAPDRDTVFEKFRQVSNTDTGKPPGTGLGLAISRRIMDHLGGRIWVESEPGAGAVFCFTLPAAQPATAGAPPPEALRTDW